MLGAMAPFEGIDVGHRPPLAGVVGALRAHGAVPLHGRRSTAVTYTPGEPAPDAGTAFVDLLREMGLRYE